MTGGYGGKQTPAATRRQELLMLSCCHNLQLLIHPLPPNFHSFIFFSFPHRPPSHPLPSHKQLLVPSPSRCNIVTILLLLTVTRCRSCCLLLAGSVRERASILPCLAFAISVLAKAACSLAVSHELGKTISHRQQSLSLLPLYKRPVSCASSK
jgi:hypothetical protein